MDSTSTRHLTILLAAILSGSAIPACENAAMAAIPISQRIPQPPDGTMHQAQVEARIIAAPTSVRSSDGARHLAYEVRITSFQSDSDPIELIRMTVYVDGSPVPLETFEGAAVANLLSQPRQGDDPKDGVAIASGQSKTFFLWLTLPAGIQPHVLRHQLVFRTAGGILQRASDIETPVLGSGPIHISAPLRSGRWLAAEGPGNRLSHHWGGMVAIDGTLSDPQRFAIDWFGLDEAGHAFRGAHASPASTVDADWIGYGRDVLAVADGVVVDARDGVANGKPLAPQETPDDLTNRSLYGNFVVLRIAPGIYAHYAHLKSGSVAVRIGQQVRRGAVIGHLGQTGAAGAPHLHFHLSDRATFEQSQGLPFVLDAFIMRDRGKRIEDMLDPDHAPSSPSRPSSPHRLEMPLDGDVITFP